MGWQWPWKRTERRESSFTDSLVNAFVLGARGTAPGDPGAIAALECAAGLYSRAFAGAAVRASGAAAAALSPDTLATMARSLIRRGESVYLIRVDASGLRLVPVGSWDVRGGPIEREWFYRCDTFGPSGNRTEFTPGAAVVHTRYAVDPARPWAGVSPLAWASQTGTLAANLELRLGEELGQPVGSFLPYPDQSTGPNDDSDDDDLKLLKADIAAAAGRMQLVESMAAGYGDGRASAPAGDWKQKRFGAAPPESLGNLQSAAFNAVLSACGVPVSLATDADGTSQRESWRRFVMGSVEPLAGVLSRELSVKLETSVGLSFAGLWAHDAAGRAAAYAKLRQSGMSESEAEQASGILAELD